MSNFQLVCLCQKPHTCKSGDAGSHNNVPAICVHVTVLMFDTLIGVNLLAFKRMQARTQIRGKYWHLLAVRGVRVFKEVGIAPGW